MNRISKLIAVALLTALVTASCGGTEEVGAQLGGAKGGDRLENAYNKTDDEKNAEETTKADPKETDPRKQDDQKKKDEEEKISVKFFIDQTGYNPYVIRVFVGGIVIVENKDSQARSVTADDGSFDSGLIKPGGTWRYVANTPGDFNFTDSTRPYVVGKLEVIAQ